MKYIDILNRFFELAEADQLPTSAQIVYLHLLNINNRLAWRGWFKVANSRLEILTGMSNKSVIDAKNRLKQLGLIDFDANGKTTTRYHLVLNSYDGFEHTSQDTTQGTSQDTTQGTSQDTTQGTSQDTTQGTSQDTTQGTTQDTSQLIRQDKTRQDKTIKRESREKKKPPSLDEIKSYIEEKNLKVSAQAFFDYFDAGNWHDAKGQPVKNWKQKILTWNKFEGGVSGGLGAARKNSINISRTRASEEDEKWRTAREDAIAAGWNVI